MSSFMNILTENSTAVVVSLAAIVMVMFIDYIFDSRVYDKEGKRIPGPRSNLYGKNFYSVVVAARKHKQSTKAIKDVLLPSVNGDICGVNLFGTKLIIVANPENVKVVLNGSHTKFPKSLKYNRLKFFLGEGLVTSSGAKWHRDRMLISPVCPNSTRTCHNLTRTCHNLTRNCHNLTQNCHNLTRTCHNLTRTCHN
jgi:Cytochrome P450